MSTSKHESSSYHNSLTVEKQQNRAKVETHGGKLVAQNQDVSDALHLERQVQEGLKVQKVQDMTTLKAKVLP